MNGKLFYKLTANVWANLDNPLKSYDFSKFWLISCIPPSQVVLCHNLWCHNTLHNRTMYLIGTVHKFHKIVLFMKTHLPSAFILLYFRAIRRLCVHLWLNVISRTKKEEEEILCTKSMETSMHF